MVDLATLASWTRAQLVEKARELGVERPERMTRLELRDEIQRLTRPRSGDEPRGLLGTARSMLASMVEAGLNMPEAAAVIRGEAGFDVRVKAQPPVATVTLAEIYAVQGHRRRALRMLDDVLAAEPDHEVARELRQRLEEELAQKAPGSAESSGTPESELVETTGEEIRTGQPPDVAPITSPAAERSALDEAAHEEPAADEAAHEEPAHGEVNPDEVKVASEAPAPEAAPPAAHTEPPINEARQAANGADSEAVRDALFFRTDVSGTRLYWELAATSVDRLSRRMPEGRAVVRVLAVHPDPGGARRDQHDVPVEKPAGVARLDLRQPAVVRAALGWLAPEGFHPLVVATDLDGTYLPPESPAEAAAVRARASLTSDEG